MNIAALFQDIISNPIPSLLVIGNLILIESLLSVDNAAVLATMVMDLPHEERKKALKYGIIGAYIFRGLCLLFASILIKIWWLKPLGGLYLIYLTINWIRTKMSVKTDSTSVSKEKSENWIYKTTVGLIGNFWSTIALVEVMDLAFSIDNVFAAVAFSENILLIWIGVFIGILAMRFVAQGFVALMEKYTFLETCAYIVIALLGIKLSMSVYEEVFPQSYITLFLKSEKADWVVSAITVSIFVFPIISSHLFNYPSKNAK